VARRHTRPQQGQHGGDAAWPSGQRHGDRKALQHQLGTGVL
jgi:hypothetical protein